MRLVAVLLFALPLCGCELIFKLPTRQGNVIEQKELDKLEVGMTREQVKFILGTPIAASAFREDRWDYVGYYKNPRGKVFSRTVTLWFDGESKLARMDGAHPDAGKETQADMDALTKEEKNAATEEERDTTGEDKKSGVVIKQKPKQ